jgi:hypothetical protein
MQTTVPTEADFTTSGLGISRLSLPNLVLWATAVGSSATALGAITPPTPPTRSRCRSRPPPTRLHARPTTCSSACSTAELIDTSLSEDVLERLRTIIDDRCRSRANHHDPAPDQAH